MSKKNMVKGSAVEMVAAAPKKELKEIQVRPKVNMTLPSGKMLTKGMVTDLAEEDELYLNNIFGEKIIHILE